MKKIIVCNYKIDIVSGAEKAIVDMLVPLKEYFNFVMYVPGEGKLSKFYENNGFIVHIQKLSNKRRKYPGLHLYHSIKFANYLKKEKFDFILCNTFFAANKVATAAKISKIPMGLFVREYFDCHDKNYKRYLNIAKVIFAVSEDVKNALKNFHQNILVTHDFIDIQMISSSIAKNSKKISLPTNTNNQGPKIAIIGRITPYKQQDLFIKSFFFVKQAFPNIEYYIVGDSSPKEEYFKNTLIKESKNSNIHFLGNRNDVYSILSLFDITCMVSDREPFPRVILESQYLEIPVIASNTGGALEMIDDYQSGIFFNVKEKKPEILAEKIIELLKNKSLSDKIKINGKKNLLDTFATKKTIDNFRLCLEKNIG